MRFLLLPVVLSLIACSTDDFTTPTDAGASDTAADTAADVASGPIVIVNQTSTLFAQAADPVADLNPPPTAGNAIIVVVTCFSEIDNCSIPTNGVNDNVGNVYRRVVEGASIISSSTHGTRGYVFIADSVAVGPGSFRIRINPNGAPETNVQAIEWAALEVSGLLPSNAIDLSAATSVKGSDPSTTVATTAPPAQPNELAVALHYMRTQDDDVAYSVAPGWTQTHVNANTQSGSDAFSIATKIGMTPGVVSHTWQHHAPTRGAAAVIATFKGRTP